MNLIDLFKKAITGGEWSVAYRDNEGQWETAFAPDKQWCADPFVIKNGEDHYIFVEQYLKTKEKGCIGYFRFIDGVPINQGVIIENNYHMSYPDVFCYKDRFYMIPETSANSTVDLYMAERFPDKWTKIKTLIQGEKLVDSTVYEDKDGFYLISYKLSGNEVRVYSLDMERKEVDFISKKQYKKNIGRPGGRLFMTDGRLMRPAQDCSRKYGETLIIYQVDALSLKGELIEHEVRKVRASELKLEGNANRVHQYTFDNKYEVVDVFQEKINLLHVPQVYLRSRKK